MILLHTLKTNLVAPPTPIDLMWIGGTHYPCPRFGCGNSSIDHHDCIRNLFGAYEDVYYCECRRCETRNGRIMHYTGGENIVGDAMMMCRLCDEGNHPLIGEYNAA